MVSPGGPLPEREAAVGAPARQAGQRGAGARLPDPPPERRRDPRRHRPAPLDRQRRPPELRRPRQPLRQADARGRRRRPLAAARARHRPRRDPGRRHDPPPPRPHLGDLRVPAARPSSSPPPSGEAAASGGSATATAAPTTTTPSTTARSTSTAPRSAPTPASPAPSTSSATARSASPSPRATPPATSSVVCHLAQRDFVIGGDAVYYAGQLDGDLRPRPAPRTPTTGAARCRSCASSALSSPTR